MLVDGSATSYSEIAKKEGLTRARITQIMNLLKLPPEWRAFLAGLDDPKDIRKYSERRLRNYRSGDLPHTPPKRKKQASEQEEKSARKNRTKRKWSPDVIAVEIDEHLSPLNLEVLKELIQKAALRKIKEHEKGGGD
jgi:ribosomal protein L28